MLEPKQSNSTQAHVHSLLIHSIQKIAAQIEQTGELKIREEPNYVQADRSPQKLDIEVKKLDRIEIESTYSRIAQSQNSNLAASKLTYKFDEHIMQEQLTEKARHFISQIRNRKKEIQGKFVLKKVAEEQRKREEQKRKEVQLQVEREISKQIRILKAQKNIQFFREKKKLYARNSNSLSPIKNRASHSKAQSRESRNSALPSLYSTQLQQIKEEPTRRKSPSLQRTVLKNKKRSHTMADMRDNETDYHNSKEEFSNNELKLFDLAGSKKSRYGETERYEDQAGNGNQGRHRKSISNRDRESYIRESRYEDDDDRKHYLMTRNKTQDISIYLQKYSNFNQIRKSTITVSPNNKKHKYQRHKLSRSTHVNINEFDGEDYEEEG